MKLMNRWYNEEKVEIFNWATDSWKKDDSSKENILVSDMEESDCYRYGICKTSGSDCVYWIRLRIT